MHKNEIVTREGITHTGKLPDGVGFKMSPSNTVRGLSPEQKQQQAENIAAWQSGKSKPYYT